MRKNNNKVIAILCSDLHLSTKPPTWRSTEGHWFDTMKRYLLELRLIAVKNKCPIICAGDVFDRWNSPPELINFAIKWLPEMYAIPGQHDLPYHDYKQIERSAYWTLVEAGNIDNAPIINSFSIKNPYGASYPLLTITAFPWGKPVTPNKKLKGNKDMLHVALVHEYVSIKGHEYQTAPREARLTKKRKEFKGWDVVCFGDNHKGFQKQIGDTVLFNCGTMMRRHSDEVNYKPQFGLLHKDGTVTPQYYDISKDKHLSTVSVPKDDQAIDMDGFVKELVRLGKDALNFETAIKHHMRKHRIKKPVRDFILESMGL